VTAQHGTMPGDLSIPGTLAALPVEALPPVLTRLLVLVAEVSARLLAAPTVAPPPTTGEGAVELLTYHQAGAVLAQLAALQSAVAARLAALPPDASNGQPDHLLGIDEAAARLGVTNDWLRRRGTLPFVVKLSEGTVRYSATGISRFIAQRQQR
jgi:hypothetical protein